MTSQAQPTSQALLISTKPTKVPLMGQNHMPYDGPQKLATALYYVLLLSQLVV